MFSRGAPTRAGPHISTPFAFAAARRCTNFSRHHENRQTKIRRLPYSNSALALATSHMHASHFASLSGGRAHSVAHHPLGHGAPGGESPPAGSNFKTQNTNAQPTAGTPDGKHST
jgi:hypothetical protein